MTQSGSARFTGRSVIVTGAGRGIGRAIAIAFAAEGADVMLVSRSPEPLAETLRLVEAAGGRGFSFACDLAEPEAIDRIVVAAAARWGRIDVLVNNAGISGREAPVLDMPVAAWRHMLAVNLDAPFLLSQQVARTMAAGGHGGNIINIASIAGLAVDGLYAHYSVSKAGLIALTKSLAVELARFRIRANAVSPGYTATDMTTGFVTPRQEAHMLSAFDRVPIRRMVTSEEIAAAVLFLASDAASGITGTNLVVDGGLTANNYILETLPNA